MFQTFFVQFLPLWHIWADKHMFEYIPATSAFFRLKYEIWKQNAGKNTVIVRVYVYGLSEAYVRRLWMPSNRWLWVWSNTANEWTDGPTDGQTEQQMKGWSDLCALYINWKYSACNGEHLHTNTYSSSLLITSLYRQNAAPLFLYVYIYLVVPYFVDEASIRKVTSRPGTNG